MKRHEGVAAVRAARLRMAKTARLLTMPTPAVVTESVPDLESAIDAVRMLEAGLRSGAEIDRVEAVEDLGNLRSELERVRALLNFAAAWHAAWARVLSETASGYTRAGKVADGRGPAQLSIHA